ncbi:dTMP kinase [Kitasatospora sp. NPDC004289]
MSVPVPLHLFGARSVQRVLLVALFVPALSVVAVAAVPALVFLPFVPGGTDRVVRLLRAHTAHARALLSGSRCTCGGDRPPRAGR